MGYGLPAAIGAQIGFPSKTVVLIAGDGSILMNNQELMTAVEQRLPLKVVIFNNGYLGMVRQWQEIDYGSRYSESYVDALPDFTKLVESYGHVGLHIESPSDVMPAIREAYTKYKDRLVFMNFITDQAENVWPMVKAGKGLTEMILSAADLEGDE